MSFDWKIASGIIIALISSSTVLVPKAFTSVTEEAEERGYLKAKVELRNEFEKEFADKNENLTTRLIDTRTELAICKEGIRP